MTMEKAYMIDRIMLRFSDMDVRLPWDYEAA
jgi:hypothetical protein